MTMFHFYGTFTVNDKTGQIKFYVDKDELSNLGIDGGYYYSDNDASAVNIYIDENKRAQSSTLGYCVELENSQYGDVVIWKTTETSLPVLKVDIVDLGGEYVLAPFTIKLPLSSGSGTYYNSDEDIEFVLNWGIAGEEAKITAAEFMVDGYHYTEPTLSGSTDSCRIYIDKNKEGESSRVKPSSWLEDIRTELLPYNTSFTYTLKRTFENGTLFNVYYNVGSEPGDFSFSYGTSVTDATDSFEICQYTYDGDKTITIKAINSNALPQNFQLVIPLNIWVTPTTATLHYIAQDSISLTDITGNLGGETGPLNFQNLQDDDTVSFINLPTGTVTNTPISIKKVKEQYTNTSGQGDPFFTSDSLKAYVYWNDGLISVRRRNSSEAEMINISVARNVNRPRLLHLKGIHGFYVQT